MTYFREKLDVETAPNLDALFVRDPGREGRTIPVQAGHFRGHLREGAMSYLRDKFPDVEAAPRVFTPDLDGLIAWLETQPPEKTYYPPDSRDCLLCRFYEAVTGTPVESWAIVVKTLLPNADLVSYSPLGMAAYGGDSYFSVYYEPSTYRAALLRARALRDGGAR